MKKNRLWLAAVGMAFCAVYACSLAFVYVEGDDAAAMAYHAMGRDWTIQLPYSPYQSGMDVALSVLPRNESILRPAAMVLSALATVGAVCLMLALAFDWLDLSAPRERFLAALLLLASVPEFFYLGLVYQPPMVGLCFVLGAHLLIRRHWPALQRRVAPDGGSPWLRFAGTAVLFGLGVSCRWDLAIYGWIILADSLILAPRTGGFSPGGLARRFAVTGLWGGLAVAVWMGVLGLSGYSPSMFLAIVTETGRIAGGPARIPIQVVVGGDFSLFTPAFLLLSAWGAFAAWRREGRHLLFAAAASLPVILFLRWNMPKGILMFVPAWVALLTAGGMDLWTRPRPLRAALRAAIVVLALLPWFVGIRMTYDDKAWGPGFELRPYDRPLGGPNERSVTVGAGAAIPTQEGERPLGGHGAVLFGGRWRAHVLRMARERSDIIREAADGGLPIYCVQGGLSFFEAELAGRGFATDEPSDRLITDPPFPHARRFRNASGKCVTLFGSATMKAGLLDDPEVARRVTAALGVTQVAAYFNDSSVARRWYRTVPAAMRPIGPRSAILDLELLMKSIKNMEGDH